MINVVGNEQNYHFQVLSILLDRLGFMWGKDLVHFSYGMVELPNGKMKSREGTGVDAVDLMAEMIKDARQTSDELGKFKDMSEEERQEISRIVGLGALKYFIQIRSFQISSWSHLLNTLFYRIQIWLTIICFRSKRYLMQRLQTSY